MSVTEHEGATNKDGKVFFQDNLLLAALPQNIAALMPVLQTERSGVQQQSSQLILSQAAQNVSLSAINKGLNEGIMGHYLLHKESHYTSELVSLYDEVHAMNGGEGNMYIASACMYCDVCTHGWMVVANASVAVMLHAWIHLHAWVYSSLFHITTARQAKKNVFSKGGVSRHYPGATIVPYSPKFTAEHYMQAVQPRLQYF